MFNRRRISAALIGLIVLVLGGWTIKEVVSGDAPAEVPGASSGLPVAVLSSLPPETSETLRLVRSGGPFPHRQDGTEFGNREKLLPTKESGYYHEYTVPTPGAPDRAARRLVTGSASELYYTGDHYRSFVVVDPGR